MAVGTFRADHWPGFPPLSLLWTSFLISSRSLGSLYLSLGGIKTVEGYMEIERYSVVQYRVMKVK